MENINQEILEKVIKLLESQPSIYESLNTTELDKGIDLVDIYSVYDDMDQHIYEEPGEIHFNMEIEEGEPIEEVKENKVPFLDRKKITLEQIRTYEKCDENYRNIAETQGELEIFLDRNQDIYKNFLIYQDCLSYGELYYKDIKYIEKVKFALILLSEWLIAICFKSKINKRILIQTQSVPRVQYKAHIILEFQTEGKKSADGRRRLEPKKHTIHEIFIAATPDMAYVLSEGFVISKLTNNLVTMFQSGSLRVKDWLIAVRAKVNLNDLEFQELLKMSREYFAEQSFQ